jgi:serine protease Do
MKRSFRPLRLTTFTQTLLIGILAAPLIAEDEKKKTRDEMVLDDRSALAGNAAWIYNDLSKAFAEAKTSDRPLIVVHRCIP